MKINLFASVIPLLASESSNVESYIMKHLGVNLER